MYRSFSFPECLVYRMTLGFQSKGANLRMNFHTLIEKRLYLSKIGRFNIVPLYLSLCRDCQALPPRPPHWDLMRVPQHQVFQIHGETYDPYINANGPRIIRVFGPASSLHSPSAAGFTAAPAWCAREFEAVVQDGPGTVGHIEASELEDRRNNYSGYFHAQTRIRGRRVDHHDHTPTNASPQTFPRMAKRLYMG